MNNRKKVIIVGGGFGGLSAAKGLGNSEFEVLLFDKTNHHLFQPLLYQVASAALSPGDIAVPIREVTSRYKNITVLMDEIETIDANHNKILTKSARSYEYDFLILAVGARHSYFGKDHWEKFAPGMKTLKDAISIRNNMLQVFEDAEKSSSIDQINLVVVGGGPTGVEMAGALAEIAKQTLINDFRRIDSSKTKIYLIEGQSQILSMYPKELSQKAQSYLENLGVEVLLNSIVTNIDENCVEVGDLKIATRNIVWAAGNNASPLLNQIGTEQDRVGRVIVNPNLSTKTFADVFVIGDAASFLTKNGKVLPGLAPVASQQGRFLAKALKSGTIANAEFKYLDKGSMATIGKSKAVLLFGKLQMAGLFAWLGWCFVHILFLIDFRNRLMVFTQWILAFVFSKRGVRIINRSE